MNKRDEKNNRGQLNLSFGMIFSIILIIVFLAFGFYAVKKLIEMQSTVQIKMFLDDFQNDVDTMRKSTAGSRGIKQGVEYSLPSKIESVCFYDDEFKNLGFTSKEAIAGADIEDLDIEKIISEENPFCVSNIKGKVSFMIVKDYGETLVTITR